MDMIRSKLVACAAALMLYTAPALADWAPSGPITLWIGFGAGGETDTLGRLLANEMSETTGWDIVVENKPGGGGLAMFTQLAVAEPDGQTLGMGVTMPVLVNLTVRPDEVPFDLDSFDYIATVALAQLALIAPANAPYDTLEDFLAWSKENGGALVGFDAKPQELLIQFVNEQAGTDLRLVSMESSAEALQNVLGGHVNAAFNAGAHIPSLEAGDVKMLASANAQRHSYAPDIATVQEQGYDIFVDPWFYIAAPAGLPDDAHQALADAVQSALTSGTLTEAIETTMHTEPSDKGPDETRAMLDAGLKNVGTLFGE
jgi:tripartite-type tricarboxylate transporter receptor subunit TctC